MSHKIRIGIRADSILDGSQGEYVFIEDFKREYDKDTTPNKQHFKKFRKKTVLCPGCKTKVVYNMGVAKNQDGTTRASFFSHLFLGECDWNNESEMHLWIKLDIAKNGYVPINDKIHYKGHCFSPESVHLKDQQVEKKGGIIGDNLFTPDICGFMHGDLYWIEVCVTHECTPEKIAFIVKNKINCIEVLIDKEKYKDTTRGDLIQSLVNGDFLVRIINHEKLNKLAEDKDKKHINDLLQEVVSRVKTLKQAPFYEVVGRAETLIKECSDTLSPLEIEKGLMFIENKKKEKFDHLFNSFSRRKNYASGLMVVGLLQKRYSTHVQKKRAIQYINKQINYVCPILNTGYYKGVSALKIPLTYRRFLLHEKPEGFNTDLFDFLAHEGKVPEFVSREAYNLAKRKREKREDFCMSDFN